MKTNNSPVESVIDLNEEVENLERYRSANPSYFPCYVKLIDNTVSPALFTKHEISVALERANKNLEDLGPQDLSWFEQVFGQ
jgi:hypothetical protein